MRLAVRQTALLVMAMTQEGFLTLGTHEMLHVPMLAQRCDHTLLNWSSTGTTNGNAHLVMAA